MAEVDFYKFIRPERKFESVEALMDEIADNVKEVKAYFGESNAE